jgi:DNA-binding transcriptional ArsR family regulator
MTDSADAAPHNVVALTTAKQMRALAHPLRMQVLGVLRINGPRTAGQLSDLFDEAPGTLSYHLAKLAEFGFIEEAPELSTDRRERWWRSAHEFTDVSAPALDAPAADRLAAAAVRHQVVDVYAATLHRVIDAEPTVPPEWAKASTLGDVVAFLTADELAQASAELDALVMKWHAAGSDRDRPGVEPVQLIVHAFRHP